MLESGGKKNGKNNSRFRGQLAKSIKYCVPDVMERMDSETVDGNALCVIT